MTGLNDVSTATAPVVAGTRRLSTLDRWLPAWIALNVLVFLGIPPLVPHRSLATRNEPTMTTTPKPTVLFVCVHNAGRSQMAVGLLTHLAGDRIEVRSAGSEPTDQLNPAVIDAMREVGIDITAERPKLLTTDAVKAADVVITMGCGDTCPIFPGKRYEDWQLDDPAGQGLDTVRGIRNQIETRIRDLITELTS